MLFYNTKLDASPSETGHKKFRVKHGPKAIAGVTYKKYNSAKPLGRRVRAPGFIKMALGTKVSQSCLDVFHSLDNSIFVPRNTKVPKQI